MFDLFKKLMNRNDKVDISWNLTDELLVNINFDENYNKTYSLKHFLFKKNYKLSEIENYMKYKNPFLNIKNNFKNFSKEELEDSFSIEEKGINRNTEFCIISVIENCEKNKVDDLWLILSLVIRYIDYIVSFDSKYKIVSQEAYKRLLVDLSYGKNILNEDLSICLNVILKRYGTFDKVDNDLNEYFNRGIYFKNISSIIGEKYLKGIVYKTIENSLKHSNELKYTSIFYKTDLETNQNINVLNMKLTDNYDNNLEEFYNNFNTFIKDFSMIKKYLYSSFNIKSNKNINYELKDENLNNKNNYLFYYEPLTKNGRNKKLPFKIKYFFNDKVNITAELEFDKNMKIYKMDIIILDNQIERLIMVRRFKELFEISEIKERNTYKDAFPRLIYKRDN